MPVLDGDLDFLTEAYWVLYVQHVAGLIAVGVVLVD